MKRASCCNYELVVPLIPKASLPEQVLEENWVEPATTQAHWENGCCHASQNGESYFIMLIRPWNNIQKYQSQCMSWNIDWTLFYISLKTQILITGEMICDVTDCLFVADSVHSCHHVVGSWGFVSTRSVSAIQLQGWLLVVWYTGFWMHNWTAPIFPLKQYRSVVRLFGSLLSDHIFALSLYSLFIACQFLYYCLIVTEAETVSEDQ